MHELPCSYIAVSRRCLQRRGHHPTGSSPIPPVITDLRTALVAWSEQRACEEVRPVVLFGRPVEERAREMATAERTL